MAVEKCFNSKGQVCYLKRFLHISVNQKLLYHMVVILDGNLERNEKYFKDISRSFLQVSVKWPFDFYIDLFSNTSQSVAFILQSSHTGC